MQICSISFNFSANMGPGDSTDPQDATNPEGQQARLGHSDTWDTIVSIFRDHSGAPQLCCRARRS